MDARETERALWALLSGIPHIRVEHAPISSASEAAEVRGTPLSLGCKALLLKTDGRFFVYALPADRQLDGNVLRRALGRKRLRFATRAELLEQTGLVPGCVPPFGSPVLPMELVADPRLLQQEEMVFTAGRRDRSVRLSTVDWRRVARPAFVEGAR